MQRNFMADLNKLQPLMVQAGEIILSYLKADKKIQQKTSVNLVTEADLKTEEYLVTELKRVFPDDAILAEEGNELPGSSGYQWIIDPLDGTTSYAHGFPFFAVSAGLYDQTNKRPVAGVVYNPFFQEYFEASLDGGSYLNRKQIKVTQMAQLSEALLGTGFPYNRRDILKTLLTRLGDFINTCQGLRRTGSAALDVCYVAAGRLDGYFEEGLKPWDTAAALLIAEEAGATSSLFNGEAADIFVPELVVAGEAIHPQIIEVLKNTVS